MADAKKAAEAASKIKDITQKIKNHDSTIDRINREKADKVKYYDTQISREKDEIKRLNKQIDDLKRLL